MPAERWRCQRSELGLAPGVWDLTLDPGQDGISVNVCSFVVNTTPLNVFPGVYLMHVGMSWRHCVAPLVVILTLSTNSAVIVCPAP